MSCICSSSKTCSQGNPRTISTHVKTRFHRKGVAVYLYVGIIIVFFFSIILKSKDGYPVEKMTTSFSRDHLRTSDNPHWELIANTVTGNDKQHEDQHYYCIIDRLSCGSCLDEFAENWLGIISVPFSTYMHPI